MNNPPNALLEKDVVETMAEATLGIAKRYDIEPTPLCVCQDRTEESYVLLPAVPRVEARRREATRIIMGLGTPMEQKQKERKPLGLLILIPASRPGPLRRGRSGQPARF